MDIIDRDPLASALDYTSRYVFPLLQKINPKINQSDLLLEKSREPELGDITINLARFCGRSRIKNVSEFVESLSNDLNEIIAKDESSLISETKAIRNYLNLFLKRPLYSEITIEYILSEGERYGQSDAKKGKKAIVEHTSANPISPIHVGNLRNVLLGSHLSSLLRAVGYTVSERYFVNDLGAQIGLTVLGYSALSDIEKYGSDKSKTIGLIYAIMNSLQELQKQGKDISAVFEKVSKGETIENPSEFESVFEDLYGRAPELFSDVFKGVTEILEREGKSIYDLAGDYCYAYENRTSKDIISLFRSMSIECLDGIQRTLNIFRVRHDQWDFESELGWEGSTDVLMNIVKNCPYYVPPTERSGGYLDLDLYIKSKNYRQGRGGFLKNYPPFYIIRPNGTTLYTFRDVVYSLKKQKAADIVLNVIGSEQNLPQEKVYLTLDMLGVPTNLYHVSYEYVKLTKGKMSGRRALYLLADELYDEVSAVVKENMKSRQFINEANFEKSAHELSLAAIKYALLSSTGKNVINFDLEKVTSFEDSSGPFILYNLTRIKSIFRKIDDKFGEGTAKSILEDDARVDYADLTHKKEWMLIMNVLASYPETIKSAALPEFPKRPKLPEFGTHRICEFLNNGARAFSSFYKKVRIITSDSPDDISAARLRMLKALEVVMENALALLKINPIEEM